MPNHPRTHRAAPAHYAALLVSVVLLSACGGGGSSGTDNGRTSVPSPQPQPQPRQLSGQAMLGPVSGLHVSIQGEGFDIEARTDVSGTFGPVSLPGGYDGPLFIEARGGPGAHYVCDNPYGCLAPDEAVYPFAGKVPFSGTLALYIEHPGELPEVVTLSPFSTAAAARAEELIRTVAGISESNGDRTPTAEGIRQANAEMDDLLSAYLAGLPADLQLNRRYYAQPLVDLTALPAGTDDQRATALALLATGLFHATNPIASFPRMTAEDLLTGMSRSFAREGDLPVATDGENDVSLERLAIGIALIANGWDLLRLQGDQLAQVLDEALAPATVVDVADAAFSALNGHDWLAAAESVPEAFRVTDESLHAPVFSIPIGTSNDSTVAAERLTARSSTPMIEPRVSSRHGQLNLDLFVSPDRTEGSVYETQQVRLAITDTRQEYLSLYLAIDVSLHLVGLQVEAADVEVHERQPATMSASSNRPGVSYQWRQTGGPEVTLSDARTGMLRFDAPDLSEDAVLVFEVTASDSFGNTTSRSVEARVAAFLRVEDVVLEDAGLADCLEAQITAGAQEDVGAITELSCPDAHVTSLGGIRALANLRHLDVSGGGFLGSLRELTDLQDLDMLDVSGQRFLSCGEFQTIRDANPDIRVLGEEACNREITLDLFGSGYDLVIGPDRERLFVSIPERHRVAVIDAASFELERFITFPAEPHGLSVSLDGDSLFVALKGGNSIAAVSLSDLGYSLVRLGTASASSDTSAVQEVQPGRLLVTSDPEGYAVQIRMNDGHAASRVADGRTLRAPDIDVDSGGQRAYLSNSQQVFQLDASDPSAPVILSADVGFNSGRQSTLSADGRRLITGSGVVLNTDGLTESRRLNRIAHAVAAGGSSRFYMADSFYHRLLIYEFDEPDALGDVPMGCPGGSVRSLHVLNEDDADFVWLSGDRLCALATRSANVLDPQPQFNLPDPQLEACVRAAAATAGTTFISHIRTLDCTDYPGIASLEGIRRLTGMDNFYSRGGTFFDLEPLSQRRLTEFSARDNPALADLTGLGPDPPLARVDVTGSPQVPCERLEALREDGVEVHDNGCRPIARLLLGGVGHDLAVDPVRDVYYVSVPALNTVSVIDAETFLEQTRYEIAGAPAGLDLSNDADQLFVATDRGLVSTIDLNDGTATHVDVSATLGTNRVWEVAEIAPGELLVAGNPPPLAHSYLVRVAGNGSTQDRVAGHETITRPPTLEVDRDRGFAYVGNGFRYNFIHKLDIQDPEVPIVLRTPLFTVHGTHSLTLTAAGTELFTQGGERVSTETFLQTGMVGIGRSQVLPNGLLAVLPFTSFSDPASITYLELDSLSPVGRTRGGCAIGGLSDDSGKLTTDGEWLLVLWNDQLCRVPARPFP